MSYITYNPNEIVYVKGIGYGTLVDCGKFKTISLKSQTVTHKRDSIIFDPDMFNSQNDSNHSKKSEEKQQKKEPISNKQLTTEAPQPQKKEEMTLRQSNIVCIRLENTQVMVYTEDINIKKNVSLIIKSMLTRKLDQITIDVDINKTLDSLKKIIFDKLEEPIANYYNFRLFTTLPVLTELNLGVVGSKSIIQTSLKDCQKLIVYADYAFGFLQPTQKDKQKLLLSNTSFTLARIPEKKPIELPNIEKPKQQTKKIQEKKIQPAQIDKAQAKINPLQPKIEPVEQKKIEPVEQKKIVPVVEKLIQIKQLEKQVVQKNVVNVEQIVEVVNQEKVVEMANQIIPKQIRIPQPMEIIKQLNKEIKEKIVPKNHVIMPLDNKIQEKIAQAIKQSDRIKQKQQKDKIINREQISIQDIIFHQCRVELVSGRHYWEFKMDKAVAQDDIWIGIHSQEKTICAYLPLCGKLYHNSSFQNYGFIAKQTDVIGTMVKFDEKGNATVTFYRNGVNCGQLPFLIKAPLTPAVGLGGQSQVTIDSKAQFPVDSYRSSR